MEKRKIDIYSVIAQHIFTIMSKWNITNDLNGTARFEKNFSVRNLRIFRKKPECLSLASLSSLVYYL